MGTRNLVMVIYKKKTLVAQYGQFDGYPEYTGEFLLEFMLNKEKVDKLKNELDGNVTLMSDKDAQRKFGDDWRKHSFLNSTLGCGILDEICRGGTHFYLNDSTSFARDSLFCEWGWVVNLDNMSLEVYEGYNKLPLVKGERFYRYNRYHTNTEFKPIKYLMTIFDVVAKPGESIQGYIAKLS